MANLNSMGCLLNHWSADISGVPAHYSRDFADRYDLDLNVTVNGLRKTWKHQNDKGLKTNFISQRDLKDRTSQQFQRLKLEIIAGDNRSFSTKSEISSSLHSIVKRPSMQTAGDEKWVFNEEGQISSLSVDQRSTIYRPKDSTLSAYKLEGRHFDHPVALSKECETPETPALSSRELELILSCWSNIMLGRAAQLEDQLSDDFTGSMTTSVKTVSNTERLNKAQAVEKLGDFAKTVQNIHSLALIIFKDENGCIHVDHEQKLTVNDEVTTFVGSHVWKVKDDNGAIRFTELVAQSTDNAKAGIAEMLENRPVSVISTLLYYIDPRNWFGWGSASTSTQPEQNEVSTVPSTAEPANDANSTDVSDAPVSSASVEDKAIEATERTDETVASNAEGVPASVVEEIVDDEYANLAPLFNSQMLNADAIHQSLSLQTVTSDQAPSAVDINSILDEVEKLAAAPEESKQATWADIVKQGLKGILGKND